MSLLPFPNSSAKPLVLFKTLHALKMFPLLFAKLHSVSSRKKFQCESASSEPFIKAESFHALFLYLIEENIEEATKLEPLWLVLSLKPATISDD